MSHTIKNAQDLTRERWMLNASTYILDYELGPITEEAFKRPQVRVSIGFPGGGRKRIGECWTRGSSEGEIYNEIFIKPTISDSVEVLNILIHELIHATDNCKSGHKGFFRRTALAVGLTGKMTATTLGDDLKERMTAYVDREGQIPHSKLTGKSTTKKQTTRMLKLVCSHCDFTARTAKKWLDQMDQTSVCPCCGHETLEKG